MKPETKTVAPILEESERPTDLMYGKHTDIVLRFVSPSHSRTTYKSITTLQKEGK